MKNMFKVNRLLSALALMFFRMSAYGQQEPMYSQYMFNMLNINPAYAGSRGAISTVALYRNQWVGFPGAPRTTSFSFDMPLQNKKIGIGAQFYDDRIGIERTTGFNAMYAFRFQFAGSGTLSLGLQAGLLNYQANYTEVNTYVPNDPAFSSNVRGILPAFAAGVYYNSDKFYVGFSAPALLKTKIKYNNAAEIASVTSRDLHLYLTAGTVFELNQDLALKPSMLIKAVSGAPIQMDLNLNLWLQNKIAVGASYRTGDAIVGMLEFQFNQQFRFGYAYDKTFSNLGTLVNGTHELMFRMEFGSPAVRVTSPRYF
jgi:type IX secretion system PorP/SprF family membrane protein